MGLGKKIKKIINLIKSLSSFKFKSFCKLFVLASVGQAPQVVVVKTKNGCISGLKNDFLFRQAVENGTNEVHFLNVVSSLLKPGNVVVDLGGNIGTHSIAMSNLVGDGMVYTFEPQSLTYSILQNNILLNKCRNVVTYRFACSDADFETISMQPFSYEGENLNNGALRVDDKHFIGDLALTRTIDSFDFDRLDFMKIDIQGSEVRALRGAGKTISKFRPYMFIEIEQQYLLEMGSSSKELIELILSFGYALYRIETHYPCDHLCVPVERVDFFERDIIPEMNLKLSSKITGSKVDLVFESKKSQNYIKIYTV